MKYFTIEELCKSDTAKRLKIYNEPDDYVISNLIELTEECLDKVRELWGNPIYVKSGYRSKQLNKAVNGVKNSHHLRGMAADITTGSKDTNKILFKMIKESDIPFTQLINENDYSWIHISYDRNDLRYQILNL